MKLRYPLVLAAVLILGAAVGLGHGLLVEPVMTATATATTPATTGTAPPPNAGPAPTPPGVAPALMPYLGTWRVHGAELIIKPDGTATERIQLGPCLGPAAAVLCTATASLSVDLSTGAPQLAYTGFRYADTDGNTVVPDSLEGLPRAGDAYRLRIFAPGVIELTPLTEHLREILGSPYRCNNSADEDARQRLCNA